MSAEFTSDQSERVGAGLDRNTFGQWNFFLQVASSVPSQKKILGQLVSSSSSAKTKEIFAPF